MEESEYKAAYNELAQNRCVFEKALTNNACKCAYSRHFWLADREGYACRRPDFAVICVNFLSIMRQKSRFALKVQGDVDVLPHNMEIRVQVGGMQGLAGLLGTEAATIDIRATLGEAVNLFGSIDSIPYTEIMPAVSAYRVRQRRGGR